LNDRFILYVDNSSFCRVAEKRIRQLLGQQADRLLTVRNVTRSSMIPIEDRAAVSYVPAIVKVSPTGSRFTMLVQNERSPALLALLLG
jgi:hypothetical protein